MGFQKNKNKNMELVRILDGYIGEWLQAMVTSQSLAKPLGYYYLRHGLEKSQEGLAPLFFCMLCFVSLFDWFWFSV